MQMKVTFIYFFCKPRRKPFLPLLKSALQFKGVFDLNNIPTFYLYKVWQKKMEKALVVKKYFYKLVLFINNQKFILLGK